MGLFIIIINNKKKYNRYSGLFWVILGYSARKTALFCIPIDTPLFIM